jgi:hypothetical protein
MNSPACTGMSLFSAIRRAEAFSSVPVSMDVWSPDGVYTQSNGPFRPGGGNRRQNVACRRARFSITRAA